MGRERIPTALVRRWLLRGALVGGAVGATLVLGAPVQAAETTPAGPVTGLLGGLTTVADDASGSVLELASGTVDHVVPAVQDAPLVRDVAVVDDLPVTDAVRGVTDRTTGVVRELTTTVDQVLAPVVRPVDTVVIEVVPPPVVDAVPATDEGHADPDEGAADGGTRRPPSPDPPRAVPVRGIWFCCNGSRIRRRRAAADLRGRPEQLLGVDGTHAAHGAVARPRPGDGFRLGVRHRRPRRAGPGGPDFWCRPALPWLRWRASARPRRRARRVPRSRPTLQPRLRTSSPAPSRPRRDLARASARAILGTKGT